MLSQSYRGDPLYNSGSHKKYIMAGIKLLIYINYDRRVAIISFVSIRFFDLFSVSEFS